MGFYTFDGVHRGGSAVLSSLKREASEIAAIQGSPAAQATQATQANINTPMSAKRLKRLFDGCRVTFTTTIHTRTLATRLQVGTRPLLC
jgi:FAD synthase